MRGFLLLFLLAFAGPIHARDKGPGGAQGGLRYRMQVWMQGESKPVEARFRLLSTGVIRSQNRVQKPRMAGWRLEADRAEGTPYAQAMMLGRAGRMLYLAGPAPHMRLEPVSLRFGARSLPVWSLDIPRGVYASAVLVEVAPKLLALCDLSARFERGDVARVELHLEGLDSAVSLAPADTGTVLLTTLQAWAREAAQEQEDGTVTVP